MAVLKDLLVDGPHITFNEARPFTAFPDVEAVAPTGTCIHLRSGCSTKACLEVRDKSIKADVVLCTTDVHVQYIIKA